MENRELKRVFDQVKLSPERQEAMLERLLSGERSGKTVKPMKKMVAVLVAAALLLMACAFTMATGLDQRILEYFGGTEEDAQLLAPGFMAVDLTSTAENGAKVYISQVYSDQRVLVLVGEMTVPEGTVLDQESYRFRTWDLVPIGADGQEPGGGYGTYGTMGGDFVWTDEDPGDNVLSFLETYYYEAANLEDNKQSWASQVDHFVLTWEDLIDSVLYTEQEDGSVISAPAVVSGSWSFKIPLSGKNFGWNVEPVQTIKLKDELVQVEEIYLSPVSLSVRLANENGILKDLLSTWEKQENSGNTWGNSVTLRDKDGKKIEGNMIYAQCSPYVGQMVLDFNQIYDPAQFQGGTVTILGQTFSLDNLQPVAE